MENHLAEFYKIIKANNFPEAFFYCNPYEQVDEKLIELPNNPLETRNKVENVLINIIVIPCICIHRKILSEHQFNQAYTIGEDLDLWVRIVKKCQLIHNNIYTVVFVSHEGRTVHLKNKSSFTGHINLIRHIIHEDKDKWISKEVRKIALSNAYYNLARHYEFVGGKSKAVFYLIYSLMIFPFYHWKKKLYMILDNCILTNWLLTLSKK